MFESRLQGISVFIAAPVVGVLVLGAIGLLLGGSFEVGGAWTALGEGDYLEHLGFSLLQALAALAIGLALGLPASWLLSRGGVPIRGVVTFLVIGPLAIPGVVLALGIDLTFEEGLGGAGRIIAAHAIFAVAAITWLVTPAWDAGDPRASEAARLLGANGRRAFFAGAGGELVGAIRVASALAFMYAFAAAGTVAILGDPGTVTTEAALAFGDPMVVEQPNALAGLTAEQSAVALVQLGIGLVLLLAGGLRWPRPIASDRPAPPWVLSVGLLCLMLVASLMWLPLFAVANEAVMNDAFADLFDSEVAENGVLSLLAWTGVFAAAAGFAATLFAWLSASTFARPGDSPESTTVRWILALPAAMTGAVIGWASIVLADGAGVDLGETYAFTIAAHALIAYPFALRIIGTPQSDATQADARRAAEEAMLLGASRRSARWRFGGQRLATAVLSAFLVSAILSAGEVAAANLLTPEHSTPAALGVLRSWGTETGTSDEAYALASVLAVATVIAFGIAEWLRRAAFRPEAE